MTARAVFKKLLKESFVISDTYLIRPRWRPSLPWQRRLRRLRGLSLPEPQAWLLLVAAAVVVRVL